MTLLTGCRYDMWVQPKAESYEETTFFPDGTTARPLVANTVARGEFRNDDAFYQGRVGRQLVSGFPPEVFRRYESTAALLERGQDGFNVYCSPCHGKIGDGNGMVAQRGQWPKKPATFHSDRLRKMPEGHFYDVITNGFGIMYSYASRIEPQDRWAIVAYIRALQRSQNATVRDVPPAGIEQLNNPAAAAAAAEAAGQGGHE